jgi:uncharacterized protein with von Willebrand factor type A (vWA) domain
MPDIAAIETGVTPKLDENIMLFVRLLRQVGLAVGPASMVDAVDAVRAVGLGQKQHVYHALASSLVKRYEDFPLFDQAFQLFWRNPQFHERLRDLVLPKIKLPGSESEAGDAMLQRLSDALAGADDRIPDSVEEIDVEFDASATATDTDRLQQRDFAGMSAAELEMAQKAIARLRLNLPMRPARRFRPASRGGAVAMRAAMRDASRQFGVVLPRFQTPVLRPRPIVVLCDISGSMEQYSRVMLHFIHMLTHQHRRVFSFLFGTRLTNITRHMRHRDVDLAVGAVAHLVEDWSGGTRISQSLATFNQDWSRRVLGQGALVMLITDGLDRTRDETLSVQIERLQKSAASLIWLNPLLRFDGFAPKSHSIRAMMSHVDHFLPIHSLASIMDLTESLAGVHDRNVRAMDSWRRAARHAAPSPQQAPIYAQEKR